MKIIITGGAGFIGVNAALDFARHGYDLVVVDNLSRRGTPSNLNWLRESVASMGRTMEFHQIDIRDFSALREVVASYQAEAVLHLAGQVAVTSSVKDPRDDFECNALGTFNVLEAVRLSGQRPLVIFSSTNKVYGGMEDVQIELGEGLHPEESDGRYRYRTHLRGIPETQTIDFHSPYGCSKGAADQYVRDYFRIYSLPTVCFRQSCIYGQRQFGIEDQGWVAWFTIAAVMGKPIHIFGDGKQVRDLLHVSDLTRAYRMAVERRDRIQGKIFNIGGGLEHSLSILGLIGMLKELLGRPVAFDFNEWRPGDQPVYISDIALAERELGWRPEVDPREGVKRLYEWILANRELIAEQLRGLL